MEDGGCRKLLRFDGSGQARYNAVEDPPSTVISEDSKGRNPHTDVTLTGNGMRMVSASRPSGFPEQRDSSGDWLKSSDR